MLLFKNTFHFQLERCIDAGVDDYASVVNAPPRYFFKDSQNIYSLDLHRRGESG